MLGICNGFQVLTEMGLLPGALMRNAGLKFICRTVTLTGGDGRQRLHRRAMRRGKTIRFPVAHHDGNYTVDAETLAALRARIGWRSAMPTIPTASMDDIAGVLSANRRVLG